MRPTKLPLLAVLIVPFAFTALAAPPTAAAVAEVQAARPAAPAPDAQQAATEALPTADVPAPRPVRSAESQDRLGFKEVSAKDDTSNAPEIEVEVEAQSAELEDVRRAEESAHVSDVPGALQPPPAGADELSRRDRAPGE